MLGLYIHIPFCKKKCGYCDFVSCAGDNGLIAEYIDALGNEIRKNQGLRFSSVYIGGGTPSLIGSDEFKKLFSFIKDNFDISNVMETTIECNPESLSKSKLAVFGECGVNRLSIGVQSFQEKELKRLGRIHTTEDFKNCYQTARSMGFNNIGIDLMYGLPWQSMSDWEYNLNEAVKYNPEHISLYPLTIEEGTVFYKNGEKVDESLQANMYEWSMDLLVNTKYRQYEISNWSKPGYECIHNMNYWKAGEYLGVGVSAASYLNGIRFKNTENIRLYIDKALSGNETRDELEEINENRKRAEEIILNLRCAGGYRFPEDIETLYGGILNDLIKEALVEKRNEVFFLTKKGKLFANQVMMRFV